MGAQLTGEKPIVHLVLLLPEIGIMVSQEQVKPPVCHDLVDMEQIGYGHIDDLCVAKSARRQGIASSMLLFAINLAKSDGETVKH